MHWVHWIDKLLVVLFSKNKILGVEEKNLGECVYDHFKSFSVANFFTIIM